MIRQLRAFAWLRWRLLLNGVRGARRRDTLEQISRMLALVAPIAIVVLSLGSVIALGIGGYLADHALATGADFSDIVLLIVRAALFGQLVVVVFMPLGIGSQSSSRYARLLLLPIHRRVLHLVEVLSGIAGPWIFVMLPGLLMLVVGLAVRTEVGLHMQQGVLLAFGVQAFSGHVGTHRRQDVDAQGGQGHLHQDDGAEHGAHRLELLRDSEEPAHDGASGS